MNKSRLLPSPDLDALSICSSQVHRNQKDVRVLVCSMRSCPQFSSQSSPSWWKPSRACTPSRSALYAASSRCSLWCRFSSIKSESHKHSTVAPTVTRTFYTVITPQLRVQRQSVIRRISGILHFCLIDLGLFTALGGTVHTERDLYLSIYCVKCDVFNDTWKINCLVLKSPSNTVWCMRKETSVKQHRLR